MVSLVIPRVVRASLNRAGEILIYDGTRFRAGSKVGYGMGGGVEIWEDFAGANTVDHAYTWTNTTISGAGTTTNVQAADASEYGVIRQTTSAAIGAARLQSLGNSGSSPLYGAPAAGSDAWSVVRLRLSGTLTDLTAWAGLVESTAAAKIPDGAGANTASFLGIRAYNTGTPGNWFGVCRSGTSETTLDLGIAANTSWVKMAWHRTASGFAFYAVAVGGVPTYIGEITTNLPASTVGLLPGIGIRAGIASARALDHDYYGLRWLGVR